APRRRTAGSGIEGTSSEWSARGAGTCGRDYPCFVGRGTHHSKTDGGRGKRQRGVSGKRVPTVDRFTPSRFPHTRPVFPLPSRSRRLVAPLLSGFLRRLDLRSAELVERSLYDRGPAVGSIAEAPIVADSHADDQRHDYALHPSSRSGAQRAP